MSEDLKETHSELSDKQLSFLIYVYCVVFMCIPLAMVLMMPERNKDISFHSGIQTIHAVIKDPLRLPNHSHQYFDDLVIFRQNNFDNQRFHVLGTINDQPILWMLDTGATLPTLSLRFAKSNGIIIGQEIQHLTADGLQRGYLCRIPELYIAHFLLSNVDALCVPSIPNNGTAVLGMSLLSKFEVNMNAERAMLSLKRHYN